MAQLPLLAAAAAASTVGLGVQRPLCGCLLGLHSEGDENTARAPEMCPDIEGCWLFLFFFLFLQLSQHNYHIERDSIDGRDLHHTDVTGAKIEMCSLCGVAYWGHIPELPFVLWSRRSLSRLLLGFLSRQGKELLILSVVQLEQFTFGHHW